LPRKSSKPAGPSQRQLRVAEEIRRTTHEILARANWREPLLMGATITVTGVRISPDLSSCTLFVTSLGGEKEDEIVAALNVAKAYVRGELGHALNHLRIVPNLRFEVDRSFGEAKHIDALLRSRAVARDLEPKSESDDVEDSET
jgi:ribosome-binding factor A